MTLTNLTINKGLEITDENTQSSYGIPVVVWNGQVFGDNDIIDNTDGVFTGRDAKIQAANFKENRSDEEKYNFITKGLDYTNFVNKQKEIANMTVNSIFNK